MVKGYSEVQTIQEKKDTGSKVLSFTQLVTFHFLQLPSVLEHV